MPDRMPRAAGEGKPRRSRLLWVGIPVFTVFAVFGGIVWLAYQENARVPDGEPPLIRAIASPYKHAPEDPGGRQIADQGEVNDLLRDQPAPAEPERVLPLPEEPRRPTIVARPSPTTPETAETPAQEAGEAATEPAPAGAPSETPHDQALSAEDASPSEPAGATAGAAAGATKEAEAALAHLLADVGPAGSQETPPSDRPASAPAGEKTTAPDSVPAVPTPRPARPPSTTAPTIVRNDAPQVAQPVDAPSKEADEALSRLLAEVAGVPADTPAEEAPPSRAVAAIAPATPPVPQRDMGPGFRVQLAAVREKDDVRRAWTNLADRLGSVVADYEPFYERAETSNGVFYRIQLGPFASEQSADRLCNEVQRRNASCFVVGP